MLHFLLLLRLVRCHVCFRRHYRPVFWPAPENPVRRSAARRQAPEVLPITNKERERRPAWGRRRHSRCVTPSR